MSHRPSRVFFLALAAFLLAPALAHADAGTPLMWLTISHLFFGNLVIGIAEGLLIAFVFKIRTGRAILLMIGANYFSAGCGMFGILPFFNSHCHHLLGLNPLKTGFAVIWGLMAVLVVLTVLLEWPFCYLIVRGATPHPWRRAMLASLAAQALSYGVLIPLYTVPSSATVLTRTKFESDLGFSKNPKATVYYLDQDGAVWSRRLDGTPSVKVQDLAKITWRDILKSCRNGDGKTWDLILVRSKIGHRPPQPSNVAQPTSATQVLIHNFAAQAAESETDRSPQDSFHDFGPAVDLRPLAQRQWECRSGLWDWEGIHASRNNRQEILWFSMENPILSWHSRSATILPGDQVVYQLSDDMIVLLDLNTRQLALVARGHGPAVGLEN